MKKVAMGSGDREFSSALKHGAAVFSRSLDIQQYRKNGTTTAASRT